MLSLKRPELDYGVLDREFERTKTKVFLGKSASFLGSIMCSMNFSWTEDIPTACTNGINLWWNPHFYLYLPPETRATILLHELWHPANMDMLRRGDRHPKVWNYAADIRINNGLSNDGYSFKGFQPWMDHRYDGWVAEDIYDDLMANAGGVIENVDDALNPSGNPWGGVPFGDWYEGDDDGSTDMVEPEDMDARKAMERMIINNVVTATHTAKMAGDPVPGDVEVALKRFLQPKIPWETVLFNFFSELGGQAFSWARPNRRYQELYLPSLNDEDNALAHVAYFLDVSGSISDGDIIRFHSEFKYVKDTFEPEKMTMIQFDTKIQKIDVFEKDDPFEETHVIGRGGTCLICVRDWIVKNKPTAVVIFSDLQVDPMKPLDQSEMVPIIWIGLNADKSHKPPHGTVVHIKE